MAGFGLKHKLSRSYINFAMEQYVIWVVMFSLTRNSIVTDEYDYDNKTIVHIGKCLTKLSSNNDTFIWLNFVWSHLI